MSVLLAGWGAAGVLRSFFRLEILNSKNNYFVSKNDLFLHAAGDWIVMCFFATPAITTDFIGDNSIFTNSNQEIQVWRPDK